MYSTRMKDNRYDQSPRLPSSYDDYVLDAVELVMPQYSSGQSVGAALACGMPYLSKLLLPRGLTF